MNEYMEDMSILIKLPADFPMAELVAISKNLTSVEVCIPGYIPPPAGLFHPNGFFYQHHVEGIKTVLLPDRNVVSRFAQLAKGRVITTDHQLRTAASLMAFAQCLEIEIEPSISFHELAHRDGNKLACDELGWFRAADSANTHDLIAVALGKRDQVANTYRQHDVGVVDLAKPLMRWRRNYVVALKVIELDALPLLPVERILRLFEWMRDEFIFAGPAALLASVYFAPNSSPKRRVFKDRNSASREAAIFGVRNAAWDLTYLSDFAKRINEQGQEGTIRYLFASFDINLRRIAQLIFELGSASPASEALSSSLAQWWPRSDALLISSAIFDHLARISHPSWIPKSSTSPNFIDDLIEEGEQRIRNSAPT